MLIKTVNKLFNINCFTLCALRFKPAKGKMIIGTGIDIIEVERVAMRVEHNGFKEFVFFQKKKMSYCDAKASPFATLCRPVCCQRSI